MKPLGLCIRCHGPSAGEMAAYCERCCDRFRRRHAIWASRPTGHRQAVARVRPAARGTRVIRLDCEEPHTSSMFHTVAARLALGFWLWKWSER
jgi:hypothetical protein